MSTGFWHLKIMIWTCLYFCKHCEHPLFSSGSHCISLAPGFTYHGHPGNPTIWVPRSTHLSWFKTETGNGSNACVKFGCYFSWPRRLDQIYQHVHHRWLQFGSVQVKPFSKMVLAEVQVWRPAAHAVLNHPGTQFLHTCSYSQIALSLIDHDRWSVRYLLKIENVTKPFWHYAQPKPNGSCWTVRLRPYTASVSWNTPVSYWRQQSRNILEWRMRRENCTKPRPAFPMHLFEDDLIN